jgi:hypothetical protein
MVLSAVIQFETNLVLYTVESENPINTPAPDYVVDITNYEGLVAENMIYNSETNTFEIVENQ